MSWLDPAGPRVGLGCMRLSTDRDRDDARAVATIEAALAAGAVVLDTARAYGHGDAELGHNERLIARVLAGHPAASRVRIVTKGGMRRPGGRWEADGRAGTIVADAEASAEALGRAPDVWLLHAVDPRVPLATTLRAMAGLVERGLAGAVGLSNVSRAQLDEAAAIVSVAAVEVAVSAFEDAALRGGVVAWCAARDVPLLAHAPLGGPGRAAKLVRDPALAAIAAERGATPPEIALAWLLDLAPCVVALPGARRPETARSALAAAGMVLGDGDRARLAARFPAGALARPAARPAPAAVDGEVVLIMGVPGAGKSRAARGFVERGYQRLNRDERGGSLRGLAMALERLLAGGARRVVLDNTYVDRATRSDVLTAAWQHRLPVRCVWFDTPLPAAQLNLSARLVEQLGHLPEPDELRRSKQAGVMAPGSQLRLVRALEAPGDDEGFAAIEVVAFARAADPSRGPGVVVALDDAAAIAGAVADAAGAPILALGWDPAAAADAEARRAADLAGAHGRAIDVAICRHPAGPPVCWCRPPLPGLVALWAHRRGVDLARVTVVTSTPTMKTLARAF